MFTANQAAKNFSSRTNKLLQTRKARQMSIRHEGRGAGTATQAAGRLSGKASLPGILTDCIVTLLGLLSVSSGSEQFKSPVKHFVVSASDLQCQKREEPHMALPARVWNWRPQPAAVSTASRCVTTLGWCPPRCPLPPPPCSAGPGCRCGVGSAPTWPPPRGAPGRTSHSPAQGDGRGGRRTSACTLP